MANVVSSIRLFPHSEFESVEDLALFLEDDLKERGGIYRVVKAFRYSGLQVGDLVVFHKNNRFVGEARVLRKLRRYARPKRIGDNTYEGEIVFSVESIRTYVPSFDAIRVLTGLKVDRQAIQRISIEDYQAIRGLR